MKTNLRLTLVVLSALALALPTGRRARDRLEIPARVLRPPVASRQPPADPHHFDVDLDAGTRSSSGAF